MRRVRVIERGPADSGSAMILVPGVQGRWEWMGPAIDALVARGHRVLTFSLQDVSSEAFFEGCYEAIDAAASRAGHVPVTLVGVSFGGVIASTYAARRHRMLAALVLVSAPAPAWRPPPAETRYLQWPRLSLPLFGARAAQRLVPELCAALPTLSERVVWSVRHGLATLKAPVDPAVMARWVRTWMASDFTDDLAHVRSRTLVITGEPRLDQVVPVDSSMEYVRRIPDAIHQTLPGTGHMGLLLKPVEFAAMITTFQRGSAGAAPQASAASASRELT